MQNNRRKNTAGSRSAMDGFVRRGRQGSTARKASLDGHKVKSGRGSSARLDGFVPRHQDSARPISFEEKDQWIDDNTLSLDPDAPVLNTGSSVKGGVKKPKIWQFGKKRRLKKGKPEPSRRKKIMKRIILVLALILVIIGGFLGWKLLKNSAKVFDGNVLGFLDSTKLKGESEGRVNILLAGTSEDDIDHDGADLTDSIMLTSIDVKNNTAFTVSIPRDLWVKYGERCTAGFEGKINSAYQCGEKIQFKENGYAEGGMGLLSKIVSTNFGIPIHYYGKINYTAFKDAVDAVGGITVTIDSTDPRGVYDPNIQKKDGGPLRLKNGPQQLNGLTALALARSRNSKGGYGMSRGDFDRTNYQRAMLVALKDKALSAGVITNPAKLGELLDAAGNNVDTDFNSSEVRRLYELSKIIKNENITSIDLASEEVNLLTTGSYFGASIVRPVAGVSNFTAIKAYFKKLTSTDPLIREGAEVVVLNASGVSGLAQQKADQLTVKGINVVSVGNAAARDSTVIIDLTKGTKNKTKTALEGRFGVKATTATTGIAEAQSSNADFLVIIGKSGAANTSQ